MNALDIALAESLSDLRRYVDDTMFVTLAWQVWEIFGACFYGVRINALLVLGHKRFSLGKLLPTINGSKMESIFDTLAWQNQCVAGAWTQKSLVRKIVAWTINGSEMESIFVKLVPSRVFRCVNAFDASIPQFISVLRNENIKLTGRWVATF
ncbi:Crinkler (CRN) [Phytophthora megakarya]|uniref:Crinkler (CRN) n=1 Tax=Phytophthora megakarya TaxID=4795 RepID=A0A225V1M1_9STRA|nr:Crinkler (CRN) [Phytophthora megakarya]